jgi:hypothetical protein
MNEQETVGQRFTQLITHLGISKNAFASSLEKTATVIQHLVDERNKPGFDLLRKVFEVYPNVSKDWLIEGHGPMLLDEHPAALASAASSPTRTGPADPAKKELAAAKNSSVAAAAEEAVSAPDQSIAPPAVASPHPFFGIQAPSLPDASVPAALAATPAPAADASWQTALYTQQMAHQLALAELRNQHLQDQQRLMQQMLDLMQRQITK